MASAVGEDKMSDEHAKKIMWVFQEIATKQGREAAITVADKWIELLGGKDEELRKACYDLIDESIEENKPKAESDSSAAQTA